MTNADVAGDHMVVMEPGYRQVRGCAVNLGASVSTFPLDPARGWRPYLDALSAAVTPATRLIAGESMQVELLPLNVCILPVCSTCMH